MNMNENVRKKLLITQIEDQKQNIKKDTLYLGVSAFAVGIGTLGVVLLGDDVLNAIKSNVSNATNTVVHLQNLGFAVSSISLYKGITSTIEHIRNIGFAKDKLEFYNEKLEEEGKSL